MAIYLNKSAPENAISDMCKIIRREQHITQAQLGKLIGLRQGDVSYIERGLEPPIEIIVKLCDLYKNTLVYQKQTLIQGE